MNIPRKSDPKSPPTKVSKNKIDSIILRREERSEKKSVTRDKRSRTYRPPRLVSLKTWA